MATFGSEPSNVAFDPFRGLSLYSTGGWGAGRDTPMAENEMISHGEWGSLIKQ